MTTRMSFLVAGKGAKACVVLRRAAAKTGGECRQHRSLDETDEWDEREHGEDEPAEHQQRAGCDPRAPSTQRAAQESLGARGAQQASEAAGDRILDAGERQAEAGSERRSKHDGHGEAPPK